jgi:hypothetical protein
MQIVINMPEGFMKVLKDIKDESFINQEIYKVISSGTPLPKGHGDLIDVDRKITVPVYDEESEEYEDKVMTILEALNKWSDEGVTIKDVIIEAEKEE